MWNSFCKYNNPAGLPQKGLSLRCLRRFFVEGHDSVLSQAAHAIQTCATTHVYVRLQHQTGRVQGMHGITRWKLKSTKFRRRCQANNPYIKISSAKKDLLNFPKEVVKNLIPWVISNQSGQTYMPWEQSCPCMRVGWMTKTFSTDYFCSSVILKKFGWALKQVFVAPAPTMNEVGYSLLLPLVACVRHPSRPSACWPRRIFKIRNVIFQVFHTQAVKKKKKNQVFAPWVEILKKFAPSTYIQALAQLRSFMSYSTQV